LFKIAIGNRADVPARIGVHGTSDLAGDQILVVIASGKFSLDLCNLTFEHYSFTCF
jgi:hypothetical protein